MPDKYIAGLAIEPVLANPDERVTIKAGLRCRDSTNTFNITISSDEILDNLVSGAGGIDAGVVAANTWYAIYAIGDSTLVNAGKPILSTNFTTPALPGTHDKFRRIGAIRTDATSDFFQIQQYDHRIKALETRLAYNTTSFPTVFTDLDLSAFIPTVARMCDLDVTDSRANGIVAYQTRPNGSAVIQHSVNYGTDGASPGAAGIGFLGDCLTDSAQVLEHRSDSAASGSTARVAVVGWYDPLA